MPEHVEYILLIFAGLALVLGYLWMKQRKGK